MIIIRRQRKEIIRPKYPDPSSADAYKTRNNILEESVLVALPSELLNLGLD